MNWATRTPHTQWGMCAVAGVSYLGSLGRHVGHQDPVDCPECLGQPTLGMDAQAGDDMLNGGLEVWGLIRRARDRDRKPSGGYMPRQAEDTRINRTLAYSRG